MNNYCTLSIEKVKSFESMNSRYEHNHRLREVFNANPEYSLDNEILINKKELSFQELYKKAIESSDYYKQPGHTIRKDAVKGFEVVLSFSHGADENIDMKQWIKDNIDFLSEYFGGRKNIKDVVLHCDESTPHLHAFIVPMTDDGRLCGKQYIDGRTDLIKLQDAYAKKMESHGLKRGEKGSFMKHNDIRQFYSELGETLGDELPAPEENENIKSYYERINQSYKNTMIKKLREKQEAEKEISKKATERLEMYKTKHKGVNEFVKKAKDKYGSVKKAQTAFEEKYYIDYGLEAMATMDPEQYEEKKEIIDLLIKAGKIREKGEQNYQREALEKYKKKI